MALAANENGSHPKYNWTDSIQNISVWGHDRSEKRHEESFAEWERGGSFFVSAD
jgi:hypothetical protein